MLLCICQSVAYSCHPISASEFFSCLKMKLDCFERSFGSSLAPDADSESSWLARVLILPITCAENVSFYKLSWQLGAVFLGGDAIQARSGPYITWGGHKSLLGCLGPSLGAGQDRGQPGQPQAQACPQYCWRSSRVWSSEAVGVQEAAEHLCPGWEAHKPF